MDSTVKGSGGPDEGCWGGEGSIDDSWILWWCYTCDVDLEDVYFFMSVRGVQLAPLRDDKFQKPISTP